MNSYLFKLNAKLKIQKNNSILDVYKGDFIQIEAVDLHHKIVIGAYNDNKCVYRSEILSKLTADYKMNFREINLTLTSMQSSGTTSIELYSSGENEKKDVNRFCDTIIELTSKPRLLESREILSDISKPLDSGNFHATDNNEFCRKRKTLEYPPIELSTTRRIGGTINYLGDFLSNKTKEAAFENVYTEVKTPTSKRGIRDLCNSLPSNKKRSAFDLLGPPALYIPPPDTSPTLDRNSIFNTPPIKRPMNNYPSKRSDPLPRANYSSLYKNDTNRYNTTRTTKPYTSLRKTTLPLSYRLEGFANLGNSCYLNAVLQALVSLFSFTNDLFRNPINQNILEMNNFPEQSLYRQLLIVIDKINKDTNHSVIDLSGLKESIGRHNSIFAGNSQQDAHEFLSEVFSRITNEAIKFIPLLKDHVVKNNLRDYLPIHRNFSTLIKYHIQCNSCTSSRDIIERFHILSLDIPDLKIENEDEKAKNPQEAPYCTTHKCHCTIHTSKKGRKYWRCFMCSEGGFQGWAEDSTKNSNQPVYSLINLLDLFFELRYLDYRCPEENCDGDGVIVVSKIIQLPRILCLHIKRFLPNFEKKTYKKRYDQIIYNESLDLSTYCHFEGDTQCPISYDNFSFDKKGTDKHSDITSNNSSMDKYDIVKSKRFNSLTDEDKYLNKALEISKNDVSKHIVNMSEEDELMKAIEESKKMHDLELKEDSDLKAALSLSLTEQNTEIQTENDINLHNDDLIDDLNEAEENHYSELREILSQQTCRPLYNLKSIIKHRGTASAGHYFTDVLVKQNWKRYNDSIVSPISSSTAIGEAAQEQSYICIFQFQQ